METEQTKRKVAPEIDLGAYVASAHAINGVDRGVLGGMVREIGRCPGTLVLTGWSDYAKHLVNLFGVDGQVLAIADDEHAGKGWRFRDVPVLGVDEAVALAPDRFVCTDIENRVRDLGRVSTHPEYGNQEIHCFPSPYSNEGRRYRPWQHSKFYRQLRQPGGAGSPESMLNETGVQFLTECLRQTLNLGGDVLEVGTGQGGSAWPLALLLAEHSLEKRLLLLDFFEALPRHHSEAVMYSREIEEYFEFYPPTELHVGNTDQNPAPILEGTWCFIHYDAGFNAERLARCFGRLQQGGIMVLDNYGNIAANPGKFDAWFETQGCRISTVPDSGQGWIVKNTAVVGPQQDSGESLQQELLQEREQRQMANQRQQQANHRARNLQNQLEEMQSSRGWKVANSINVSLNKVRGALGRRT